VDLALSAEHSALRATVRRWVEDVVVPTDQPDAAVAAIVAALLADPRDAVIETKALLLGARGNDVKEQLAAERQAQARRIRDLAGAGE